MESNNNQNKNNNNINNNNLKKLFWCFNCKKEVESEYNKEEDSPQCSKCKSPFIEEIEQNLISEEDNPKNFIPQRTPLNNNNLNNNNSNNNSNSNNNQNEEEQLIFLPDTVNCIEFNQNNSFNSIFSNLGGIIQQIFSSSNNFILNHINEGALNFLSNHNNDTQFNNFLNLIMQFDLNNNGNPPASQRAIESLQKIKVNEENFNNFKEIICNVCLNNFEINDVVTILECKHEFHLNCILEWLKIRNTCPVCRFELESNNPDYERRKNSHRETLRNIHQSYNNNNGNNNNDNNNNNGGTFV